MRKALGITQSGPERLQCFVMIHFTANLRALVATVRVSSAGSRRTAPGVFVAHDIDHEWVFMHAFDPDRRSGRDTCGAAQPGPARAGAAVTVGPDDRRG